MKVFIVDDEAHIREMMRLTLETAGYEVEEAASGEDALGRLGEGEEFDAVLLDQKMPGMDGLQTLKRIRERSADACVVMVTAFASVNLAVDAMKLGATDFLSKPMTPETLRGAVAAAIASRPLRRAAVRPSTPAGGRPAIQVLTLNGFQILQPEELSAAAQDAHVFRVRHFPDGAESTVTVSIDPEAVARVARLARRDLKPNGAFWRTQAERLLSAFLWSESRPPDDGRLTVRDVSREDLDLAAVWRFD
jgi:CheY-like chemotaxis protein